MKFRLLLGLPYASLAQWVEQHPCKMKVACASQAWGSSQEFIRVVSTAILVDSWLDSNQRKVKKDVSWSWFLWRCSHCVHCISLCIHWKVFCSWSIPCTNTKHHSCHRKSRWSNRVCTESQVYWQVQTPWRGISTYFLSFFPSMRPSRILTPFKPLPLGMGFLTYKSRYHGNLT